MRILASILSCRANDDERKTIEAAAEAAGVSVSSILREGGLRYARSLIAKQARAQELIDALDRKVLNAVTSHVRKTDRRARMQQRIQRLVDAT